MKLKILALLLLIYTNSALAVTLQEAKARGLVGERNDGYVGYVVKPASNEIKLLVKSINNKRLDKFKKTAKNNGIAVEKVAALFYKKAVSATRNGNFYQSKNGGWEEK